MDTRTIYTLVESGIMFLGGLYGTLLANRIVGRKAGEDAKFDAWHARWGRALRWIGPSLMVLAVVLPLMRRR